MINFAFCDHEVNTKNLNPNILIWCDTCQVKYLITIGVQTFYFNREHATPENNRTILAKIKSRYSEDDYKSDAPPIWICFDLSGGCRSHSAIIIKDILSLS